MLLMIMCGVVRFDLFVLSLGWLLLLKVELMLLVSRLFLVFE